MVTVHTSSKDARFVRASNIAPLVAGGLIAGGASLLGGALSAWSGASSQNKYLKGVRETNETNLQLAREQREWDLAQWQRENEYNSAKAQLGRWTEAGFSPQSFAGVGTPGEAAALQSPTMANQVAPGDLSGYAGVTAQGIQSGINGAAKAALDWQQMDINQKQLNLDKERLANQTKDIESQIKWREAATAEMKANIKFIEERCKFTEQERYLSNAKLEKLWQEYEQSAKIFPHVFGKAEYEAKQKYIDWLFSDKSFQYRVKQTALDNGWTEAQTYKTVKEGIYWAWQGKEGEFQYDTQDLRWSILRTNRDQLQFNLKFDQDTRYSSWSFDRWMRGIDAATKVGRLVLDGVGELRNWVHPGNWLGNTMTRFGRDDKGRISTIERDFMPYSRF